MIRSSSLFLGVLLWTTAILTEAFTGGAPFDQHGSITTSTGRTTFLQAEPSSDDTSDWLQEFSIASGEVIDPYQVLDVPREAERREIRDQYVKLSRRYHPDSMSYRKNGILPGRCNSLEEARDEWERIKLAYEILSNPTTRKRYHRHEALADPGAAVQRAAVDAVVTGVVGLGKGVGKGLFDMGAFAVDKIRQKPTAPSEMKQRP